MLKTKLFVLAAAAAAMVAACGLRQSDVADCSDRSRVSDAHQRMLCENHKKMTEHRVPDTLPRQTKGW